jgi:hypothetical protein
MTDKLRSHGGVPRQLLRGGENRQTRYPNNRAIGRQMQPLKLPLVTAGPFAVHRSALINSAPLSIEEFTAPEAPLFRNPGQPLILTFLFVAGVRRR